MKYLIFSRYNGRNAVVSAEDAVAFAAEESASFWNTGAQDYAAECLAALRIGDFCTVGLCCATAVNPTYSVTKVMARIREGEVG